MKKTFLLLISSLLFASNINALQPSSLKNAKSTKPEQGWRFGNNPEINTTNENLKTIKQILLEMLKVQKEQLKTQKKILAILQDQFEPKPKWITLPNGKKCIANSSAECFQMPLTPIAKRIPVLKNWLLHRDEKSAAAYIKWQSKYLSEINKAAYAYQLAVTEYGNKVAKLDYSGAPFEEVFGYTEVLKNKYQNMLVNKYGKYFHIYVFLGENPDLDIYSFTSIADFINKHPDIKYTIIFKTKDEKKAFVDAGGLFNEIKEVLNNKNVNLEVMPSLFSKLNIYTTPTISVKLNNSNVINKVLVGRPNGLLTERIINYLKFKGIIKEGENPVYKAWQKAGNYSKEYYKHYYGVNVDKIIKTYKGEK